MKILVTGAEGQLGKSLESAIPTNDNFLFKFVGRNELDITKSTEVFDYFSNEAFDYCINCAAYTAVDKAEDESDVAFIVNAEAAKNLAEACKKYNCTLIHISTDFIFDGNHTEPIKESDTPNPINIYGASKLKGEKYVSQILKQFFIIRTSWVYSEFGNNFVKTMLKLSEERTSMGVVADQKGSPTYARDLAEFILLLITLNSQKFGIYHYSNSGTISWHTFARKIFELSKRNIEVSAISTKEFRSKAERPTYSVLDLSKTENTFGKVIKPWENSLKSCLLNLNEFSDNGI